MFSPKYLVFILVVAIYADSVTCDYFTSVSGLEVLLEAEGNLLNSLKDLMLKKQGAEDKELLIALSHIKDEYKEATNDSSAYLSNPISAFKLIKRFVVDWSLVEDYVQNDSTIEDLAIALTKLMDDSFKSPTEDDLTGAALGLVRLQETYHLNVTELADGKIFGIKYGSAMTASDCLELGLSLYDSGKYKNSLGWLQEAMTKLKQKSSADPELMAELMRYISTVYFHLGNSKMALFLTNDILKNDPLNEDALENKKVYEAKVFEDRNSRKIFRQPFVKTVPKKPSLNELYEMTCRGELHQTPSEQRPLRCMYRTNEKPYRLIAPFKVEQLSLDPLIVYYHDAITESGIKKTINESQSIIVRSTVGDLTSVVSDIRTSKTGWLYYENHEFLNTTANLLEDVTGLSLATAEALQVVNYGIGGHYGPHWDFSLEPGKAYGDWRGNRFVTALFYLNDVELGGATAFPFLKLVVPPVKGSLVMWYNLHDSLEPDFRTKHAGCPVIKGSKWILNEWFHERGQEFLKPCSVEEQGAISRQYEHIV